MKKTTAMAALLVLLLTTAGLADVPLFSDPASYGVGDTPRGIFLADRIKLVRK